MLLVPLSDSGSSRVCAVDSTSLATDTCRCAAVMFGERRAQIRARSACRQRVEMQRHADQHALAEIADRGHEDRRAGQPGIFLDLRHMLMLEREAVKLERRRAARLVGLDHRFAAAGIAADRADRDGKSFGSRPASVSGRSSAIAPVAWQPGLVTFLAAAMSFACSFESSGKPKTQSCATRCALEASITRGGDGRKVLAARDELMEDVVVGGMPNKRVNGNGFSQRGKIAHESILPGRRNSRRARPHISIVPSHP